MLRWGIWITHLAAFFVFIFPKPSTSQHEFSFTFKNRPWTSLASQFFWVFASMQKSTRSADCEVGVRIDFCVSNDAPGVNSCTSSNFWFFNQASECCLVVWMMVDYWMVVHWRGFFFLFFHWKTRCVHWFSSFNFLLLFSQNVWQERHFLSGVQTWNVLSNKTRFFLFSETRVHWCRTFHIPWSLILLLKRVARNAFFRGIWTRRILCNKTTDVFGLFLQIYQDQFSLSCFERVNKTAITSE